MQIRRTHTTSSASTLLAPEIMVFPDLAVNLIYAVLCLVPGFLSLQIVIHTADIGANMDEFEKTTWSLIGSGGSLSLLYFLYVIWMGITTERFTLIYSLNVGWVDLLVIYPILLFVAFLLGFVSAGIITWTRTRSIPTSTLTDTDQQD